MPYSSTTRVLPLQFPVKYNMFSTVGPVTGPTGKPLLEVNSVHPPAFLYNPPSQYTALPWPRYY